MIKIHLVIFIFRLLSDWPSEWEKGLPHGLALGTEEMMWPWSQRCLLSIFFKAMTFEHWMVKDLTFYCWWMLINIHEHLVGNAIFWTLDQAFVFFSDKKHTILGAHEGPLHSLTQGFLQSYSLLNCLARRDKTDFLIKRPNKMSFKLLPALK